MGKMHLYCNDSQTLYSLQRHKESKDNFFFSRDLQFLCSLLKETIFTFGSQQRLCDYLHPSFCSSVLLSFCPSVHVCLVVCDGRGLSCLFVCDKHISKYTIWTDMKFGAHINAPKRQNLVEHIDFMLAPPNFSFFMNAQRNKSY